MCVKRFLAGSLVLALLVCSSGCLFLLGGSAGAGAAMWYKGKLRQEVSAKKEEVYKASKQTLESMGLRLLRTENGVEEAEIKAEYADETRVWVYIEYISTGTSRVSIRVGLMGDEERSRHILDRIYKHL